METIQASVNKMVDSFAEGDLEHATETLSALWGVLNSDDDIKALVVEWSELLAAGQFADALNMFPIARDPSVVTPERLEKTIAGYGVPRSLSQSSRG